MELRKVKSIPESLIQKIKNKPERCLRCREKLDIDDLLLCKKCQAQVVEVFVYSHSCN